MRFNRLIYLFLLLLWLLATKSTKYIGENKKQKTGNFNRGESLDSPHTGYGPVIGNFEERAGKGGGGGVSKDT